MTYNIRDKQFDVKERTVWQLAADGNWEPKTFDMLDKYIVPGKVFIDIGAWCGIFSLYAEKLGAEVHAIEPDPVAFEELINNIKDHPEMHTYKVAIASWDGTAGLMNTSQFGNSESSLLSVVGKHTQTEEVLCYTLESWSAGMNISRICLIKMDVEGAEIMILRQSKGWLQKHKPPMWISFHPGYFDDFEMAFDTIIEVLFPDYDCGYSECELEEILRIDNAFHTFLFLPL